MRITTSTPTQEIFDYYRSQGFPNYKREDYSPSKELRNIASADTDEWRGKIDLAFTSPPYFDTEKYADEPTQSYIAYPTLDKWLNSFIRPTLEKAYYALKDDGVLGINYADNEVARAISTIATQVGFKESRTFKLELSSISGKKAKYEPIMVFAKGDIKYQPTLF